MSAPARSRLQGVWWLSPPGAVLLTVPASLGLTFLYDDAAFRQQWGSPKVLTDSTAWLFAFGTALLALGALLVMAWPSPLRPVPRWPGLPAGATTRLRRASTVVFRLTMLGYVTLLLAGVARGARPAQLVDVLFNQDNFSSTLRSQFAPVTGVTTLTQLGIAYVVLAGLLLCGGRDPRTERRLALVVGLALLRAFFLTERLAILELMIPLATIAALCVADRHGPRVRGAVLAAPFLLVPAVIAVFSVFEYSRSWVFYSQQRGGSFVDFALDRFAGYYATAYNNGQLALTYQGVDTRAPYGSIEGLWTAPGIQQWGLYQLLTGRTGTSDYADVLRQHGNIEFNNPGGLSIPFMDYGTVGGLVFFLLVGALLGLTYRRCGEGRLWAVLLYPVFATGLFEVPRYLYWGQGRVAPTLVALLVVAWYVRRSRVRTPDRVPSAN
ncbi:oligosaccharide repeat unit polymerase [Kineococcus sp. R8]|uniref:O-antigen polymerase n=1 Tax=Kineococcus siccus TaxID=2696567 RepID=UPI0014128376|nr:O-antigen polymerase [Kineococcus siccus]NAZ81104.1 oligosaccharide repeat unit polymerase [Kineococcus siccus]